MRTLTVGGVSGWGSPLSPPLREPQKSVWRDSDGAKANFPGEGVAAGMDRWPSGYRPKVRLQTRRHAVRGATGHVSTFRSRQEQARANAGPLPHCPIPAAAQPSAGVNDLVFGNIFSGPADWMGRGPGGGGGGTPLPGARDDVIRWTLAPGSGSHALPALHPAAGQRSAAVVAPRSPAAPGSSSLPGSFPRCPALRSARILSVLLTLPSRIRAPNPCEAETATPSCLV